MSAEPAWDREQQRETPNSVEAEAALLGAILNHNDALYAVADFLKPSHFYEPLHRKIFEVASELIRTGKMASPITIKSFLPADDKIGEDMTVARYLVRLASHAVNIVNAPDYGRTIFDMATRRSLITIGQDLIRDAYDLPVETPPHDLGEKTIGQIATLMSPDGEMNGSISFEDAVAKAIDTTNAAYMADGERAPGVVYGFPPLERLIGSLFPGQEIVIGGATKAGKSALAAQIAINAARNGHPVWFYSPEMSAVELAMRELSRDTKISVARQKRGELREADFERLVDAAKGFKGLPALIQKKQLTLPLIRERCRYFIRKRGQKKRPLIVVDGIGLVGRDKGQRNMDLYAFCEEVTRELKSLAQDEEVPVIAAAQLKKNTFADAKTVTISAKSLENIVRRRPRATDLVGAVERDADQVVIPFRPEVLLAEQEPTPGSDEYVIWEAKMNEWRGKAQLVLALSRERHWPRVEPCGWDGPTTTFFETGAEASNAPLQEFEANPMRLF